MGQIYFASWYKITSADKCRFDGEEVYVTRDDATGDVLLSSRPGAPAWREFFELVHALPPQADFMAERPMNTAPVERGLFVEEA